jgi:hypothetical protein
MKNVYAMIVFVMLILTFIFTYPIEHAYPPSTSFIIKKIREELIGYTKFSSSDKFDYYSYLLDTRLSEVEVLVQTKQYDQVIAGTSKYASTASELVNFVKTNQLNDKKELVKQQFARHRELLTKLSTTYPPDDEGWKFLLDAVNYLDSYEGQLN